MSEPTPTNGLVPMTCDEWDQHDLLAINQTGEMLEDFGPWKKGEHLTLWFDFERGVVEQWHDEPSETPLVSLRMKLVVVND